MSQIVLLRPEPGATKTMARARDRGLDPISIPLFSVEAIDWNPPEAGSFDALLLTSANAVRFGGEQLLSLRGLPVHAVGKATAEAARDAGFDIASQGDSGVDRLLGSLDADLKLLHLCGEDRALLAEARQSIDVVTVYRSSPIDPAPAIDGISGNIVLVYSPRAGRQLASLADEQEVDRGTVTLVAISEAAAQAAAEGWRRVEAADQPTDDALLALAERLCDKQRQE